MSSKALKIQLGRDCVVVTPGYNGDRHYDEWIKHEFMGVVVWTYPDGELISVQVPANIREIETFQYEGWLPSSFDNLTKAAIK